MKKRLKFPNKKELTREELERYNRYAIDLFRSLIARRKYKNCVTVFGSRKFNENNEFYIKARELGAKLAKNGHTVVTGGGPGIMEAANRGAHEAGGETVGFHIDLPEEQSANAYAGNSIEFRYFFSRKLILASSSRVWVFFPGGFGTLDELFETLTLLRDGKVAPDTPIILVGKKQWKWLDELIKSDTDGVAFEASNLELYKVTDDIDEVVKIANQVLKTES